VATFTVIHNSQRLPATAAKYVNALEPAPRRFPSFVLFESEGGKYVEAEDLPAIQALFSKYCDKDGLMTKRELEKTPPFEGMLVSWLLEKVWINDRSDR
jgi:hypothetical protein